MKFYLSDIGLSTLRDSRDVFSFRRVRENKSRNSLIAAPINIHTYMNFISTRISEQPERLISSRTKKKKKKKIYLQYTKIYIHT